jgi:hypothetical protein
MRGGARAAREWEEGKWGAQDAGKGPWGGAQGGAGLGVQSTPMGDCRATVPPYSAHRVAALARGG